jgi:hypothetical protein
MRRIFVLAAAVASLAAVLALRDFTVDDALVAVRYAGNLARGVGWRFDRHGVVADGVTPLPLPLLLVPLCRTDPLTAFTRTRVLMGVAHAATIGLLLRAVARERPSPLVASLVVTALLLAFPLAAYALSGMETPLAALLATSAAVSSASPRKAALLAGLAATIRPELAPWALVVAFGFGLRPGPPPRIPFAALALAAAPPLLCALVRVVAFGSPAPLALQAKPSDVATGARYVLGAFLTTGAPILVWSPRALVRAGRVPLTLMSAFVVHALVVLLVGGDWMPFARLFVPVLPSLIYAFVLAAPFASVPWMLARAVAAFALAVASLATSPPELRHLWPARLELARAARPVLQGAERVATLDIGWPTLAIDADLIDLAGLTDPDIAVLPGGHTSKHIDGLMLLNRHPDFVLLYTNENRASSLERWRDWTYPRLVEARLVSDDRFASHTLPAAFLPLGTGGYLVLRVSP